MADGAPRVVVTAAEMELALDSSAIASECSKRSVLCSSSQGARRETLGRLRVNLTEFA